MSVYYADDRVTLYHGDCLDVLAELPECSVDSVCTDPPYGLEFMGKDWDAPWRESDVNADAGFKGGGISATRKLPSYTGSTNPKCLNCKGTRRGRRDGTAKVRVCLCPDGGEFPNYRAVEMRAFQQWCEQWASECLRVLKPGGHLLAFGGTRTWHRLACAIEDAGFEIRDSIAWLYGSGFPKSLNVSRAVDKFRATGISRELTDDEAKFCAWIQNESGLTEKQAKRLGCYRFLTGEVEVTNTAAQHKPPVWARRVMVPTAKAWEKIKAELDVTPPDWVEELVKNPPKEIELPHLDALHHKEWRDGQGTEGANEWAGWGTALKPAFEPIVFARKPLAFGTVAENVVNHGTGALNIDACRVDSEPRRIENYASTGPQGCISHGHGGGEGHAGRERTARIETAGRWPTNVVLDEAAAAELDEQTGVSRSRDNQGGASRFFPVFRYQAKAPKRERPTYTTDDGKKIAHPTVKPLELMRWLIRLVTPPGGVVLEPFAGSGTTVEAAILEHVRCIAIEREADYLPLVTARLTKPMEAGFDFEVTP
ncbi:methyltransferase [Mycobacterium phage Boilgate]|nr:methyltransferase [Mycobacterium phage Boilgate]